MVIISGVSLGVHSHAKDTGFNVNLRFATKAWEDVTPDSTRNLNTNIIRRRVKLVVS